MKHAPNCNDRPKCICGSYYVDTAEEQLDRAKGALTKIAQLGANPITEHGCESRVDFMRHCTRMWHVAFDCANELHEREKKEETMSFCASLTDNQVINVLKDEKSRMEAHPEGNVHDGAVELYHEAREELLRRGIEPDDALTEDRCSTCPHCNMDILPADMEEDHCTQCGKDLE